MALRVRLENGEMREYKTMISYGGGESNIPVTYETMCGVKWISPKQPYEGCDHLDCAIRYSEEIIREFKTDLKICFTLFPLGVLVFTLIFGEESFWFFLSYYIFAASLLIILSWWDANRSSSKRKELIEFRDYGTINGIKARKI